MPLILCYLEGRTQDEAAGQLGWSKNTLRRRLEEARGALGSRLKRRGIVWSAALFAILASDCMVSAGPAPGLIVSTLEAATGVSAGKTVATVVSAKVATLTQGVLNAMMMSKLKAVVAVALVLGFMATGATVLSCRMAAAQSDKPPIGQERVKTPQQAEEPKPEAFKAEDVLGRMAKAYAACKSYQDSGNVKTVFVWADRNRTVEKPFTTAFVRPDRFRFEYKEKEGGGPERRHIVWRKGKEVQTWWDVQPGVEKPESLEIALAGATGVSGMSAHTVPALLLPKEVGGRRLTDITEAKRIDDAKLDKVDCFCIEGKFGGNPITLWIDQKTFLVRRIDAQQKFDDFRTETTTTYDPAIDEEIPDKKLEFDPPKQK
jgi:outer membrane lipoprotein-sorting protein